MWMVAGREEEEDKEEENNEEEDKEEEQMEVVEVMTGIEEEMKNRGKRWKGRNRGRTTG